MTDEFQTGVDHSGGETEGNREGQHYRTRSQPKVAVKVGIGFSVFFCLFLILFGCEPDKSSIPNDERIGDRVIAALEKYKSDTGSYPDVLSELEPRYIPKITPPKYGAKRWDYIHYCKKDTFALFMWGREAYEDGYYYDNDKKKWGVVENSF